MDELLTGWIASGTTGGLILTGLVIAARAGWLTRLFGSNGVSREDLAHAIETQAKLDEAKREHHVTFKEAVELIEKAVEPLNASIAKVHDRIDVALQQRGNP